MKGGGVGISVQRRHVDTIPAVNNTVELSFVCDDTHADYEDENISISLVDFSVLAGNIPDKQKKLAIQWTKDHIDFLRAKWNEYHRYRIPVLGCKIKKEYTDND